MNPRWSTPIDDKDAGEVLRWYEGLEAQVMDFISVVPPHGSNLCVWSSKVATVLVEACCLIESIFHQFKDDAATVQGKGNPGDKLNLPDYAELYGPLLRLHERTAILLTDTPKGRTPYSLWADLPHGEPQSPEWWKLYNRSKHRRIGAFVEFTSSMAIDALAGALVIISTVPAFTSMMVRREWLFFLGSSRPREGLIQDYQQTLLGQRSTPVSNDWPFRP